MRESTKDERMNERPRTTQSTRRVVAQRVPTRREREQRERRVRKQVRVMGGEYQEKASEEVRSEESK